MKKAIYPGTFDPPTLGHLNIIERSAALFDELIIGVGISSKKENTIFTLEERLSFLKKITKSLPNVSCFSFPGLLVDFAQEKECDIIVRGIRNILDFEYETTQSQMNKALSGIETLYLFVDERFRMISSTLVKEIGKEGKKLETFVPSEICDKVLSKLHLVT